MTGKSKTSASLRIAELLKGQARKRIRPMRIATLLSKLGEVKTMDSIKNDPLVQYLKKQAAIFEDNLTDMVQGPKVDSEKKECVLPTQRLVDRGRVRQALSENFDNTEGIRKKFTEKETEIKI